MKRILIPILLILASCSKEACYTCTTTRYSTLRNEPTATTKSSFNKCGIEEWEAKDIEQQYSSRFEGDQFTPTIVSVTSCVEQ